MDKTFLHIHHLIDTVLRVRFTDLEKERSCCEEVLQLTKDYSYAYAKAFAYTYLGDYYLARNDAILSGQYLYEAKQLCSKEIYPALYMKVCHLSGFYYHLINDEQNALQYYMESIALAETLGDTYQMCNAWNNIADMFQRHKQYEEAIRYYNNAYQAMCENNLHDARLLTIVSYNLAEAYGYLNEIDKMELYLKKCEEITEKQVEDRGFYLLCCKTGRFLQAAFREECEHARNIAAEIFDANVFGVDDRYILLAFLLPITQELVRLKEKEFAKAYLAILNEYCSMNEISFIQRLIDLQVLYAETFSIGEELCNSYQEYCHAMRNIIKMEDHVRVSGMNAKIHLQEIIVMHESTLQENKRLEDEINVDGLTNIYNRRYLNQSLITIDDTKQKIGIIMLDIDYFKEYNDTYGHIHGDLILRTIGDILKALGNQQIIPCRYGGDEFACLCYQQSDEEIEDYIEQVQSRVKEQAIEHKHSKCSDHVTLSIGYCNASNVEYLNTQEVIKHADEALYHTKAKGRNAWSRYENH